MNRLKRRILVCTALVVLILIGLVVFFYRPTRLALERAEAFQFRRMLVNRQADHQNVYRFFFVTNRNLEPAEEPLEERFGNQRQEQLKFGFFDTTIEPDVIVIYKGPLEAYCETLEELTEEIEITVVHEVAHHFGIDEEMLARYGYG